MYLKKLALLAQAGEHVGFFYVFMCVWVGDRMCACCLHACMCVCVAIPTVIIV